MIRHQQQLQIANANKELEQIHGIIAAAKQQLSELQLVIKTTQHEHNRKLASLKTSLRKKLRIIQREHDDKADGLRTHIELLRKETKELTAQKGVLVYEIGEQQRALDQVQKEFHVIQNENGEKLSKLRNTFEQTEESLRTTSKNLIDVTNKFNDTTIKLQYTENSLVQVEQTYIKRSNELQTKLREAESNLGKTERMIQEYEVSIQAIREADKAHSEDLQQRETILMANTRALGQQRQDFEAEKRRFYQTKSL